MGGGVSEYVQNISERLAIRHHVTVYTTNPSNRLPRYDLINGVKVERFSRIAPNQAYFFSLEMMMRLRKTRFDIVHAHDYHTLPLHFSYLADCRRLVLSTHFHGVGHSPFRNVLFKFLKPFGKDTLRKADAIVAVSYHEKSLLQMHFGLDPAKIVVIPCGLNLADFESLRKHPHDFRSLLYVGRLERYKGIQHLIDALPYLDQKVILEIIGKGNFRKTLEERARKLGVTERVRFYQDLSRDELLQKYIDADLFVLLSRYEAYSMVIAEALTARIPCIVANTSALHEWVDNENCFGVDLPVDLTRLVEMINTTLKIKISGIPGERLLGSKILDWNEVVERLESIYKGYSPDSDFNSED
jgi:glycosyltransferase involved in cell wall biosynthesis